MKSRINLFTVIIAIALIIGTGGIVIAQTSDSLFVFYYVVINNQSTGPYDPPDLRMLISMGTLTANSLVWREGMAGWARASNVSELAPLFRPPATPPPLTAISPTAPSAQPPQQQVSQAVHDEPWGGHPAVAGSVNTFFGIWSFTNSDFSGGFTTVALQVGGAAVSIIGRSLFTGSYTAALMSAYLGYSIFAVGTVYGYYRGFSQYNRRMAAATSFAEAIGDNPLNNISLVAFPAFDDRRFVGALTYSFSY